MNFVVLFLVSAIAVANGISWVSLFVIFCGRIFFLCSETQTSNQEEQVSENVTSIENTTQASIETEATGGNITALSAARI